LHIHFRMYTLKMLGYFNPNLGQVDKHKCWVKNVFKKKIQLKVKVEVGLKC